MPNGVDKNLVRLAIACAAFRERYGEWPTEARVAPIVLWDYGQLLDPENFARLCARLRLRTTKRSHVSVGSATGHVVYEAVSDHPAPERTQEAWRWLGIRVRPELAHLD